PVAAGLDYGVERVHAAGEADDPGDLAEVDQFRGAEVHQGAHGFFDVFGGCVRAGVVADDDVAARAAAHGEFIELQGQQPAVLAELQDVLRDFLGDPADHFLALQGDGDVPDGHHRLNFQGRQRAGHLVQP